MFCHRTNLYQSYCDLNKYQLNWIRREAADLGSFSKPWIPLAVPQETNSQKMATFAFLNKYILINVERRLSKKKWE